MDAIAIGLRILRLFNFCYNNKLDCSICWHEGAFHVYVSQDGNVYSSGEQSSLTGALDECASGFLKVGWTE